MKMPNNSVSNSVSSASSASCKRHNIDSPPNKSENEPLALYTKRQRTKSGTETMDVSSACNDLKLNDNCANATNKSETSPLCERNIRTGKLEVVENVQDKNCNTSDNGNINTHIEEPTKETSLSNGNSDNYLKNGNDHNKNGHCSSTLEYVTQLPEGCSGAAPVVEDNLLETSRESDGELDDDNYLDSSEGEDDEEALLGNNDEEESCGEDDQSVVSTITVGSTCSLRSVASEAVSTIYMNEHGVAANEDGSLLYSGTPASTPLPALSLSLFSHVPPSVNFCQYNESTEKHHPIMAKLLKWKFAAITPLIVRKTVTNTGYKITKRTVLWMGTWGKHMKTPCFKAIKDFQKINHFPGTFQIGRKDKLWKNFARLQSKFGKEEFGFIPKTFVLPGDVNSLKTAFEKEGVKKKWIVKPPASARGTGIQVVNKWSQMPTDTSVVVQRYISRPYLINDTKFDMRIYVLVTSFHPLVLYLYQDGLVRFASVQYNKASKTLGDRYMHLTNYSVNKTSSSYTHNEDAGQCQGHKWTLRTLWGYLKARDVDTGALWSRIADLVIKTMISGENDIVIRTRKNIKSRYCCYELFGFDVILDEKLRPWLLEVNISPSLHSASPLDHSVKGPLIADLLNISSFHAPDRISQDEQTAIISELNLPSKVSKMTLDRRLYTRLLTAEEQYKHTQINSMPRSQYLSSILEKLTPDDVRHLIILEDQLQRAGKFTCIFPTADTYQYFGFLDKPRYYNRLFDAWETTYSSCREKGIEVLENLCKEKHHLKVPTKFKMPKNTVSSTLKSTLRQPSPQKMETDTATTTSSVDSQQTNAQEAAKSTSPLKNSSKKDEKPKIKKRKIIKVSANPLKPAVLAGLNNMCGLARETEEISEEYEEIDEEIDDDSSKTSIPDLYESQNLISCSDKEIAVNVNNSNNSDSQKDKVDNLENSVKCENSVNEPDKLPSINNDVCVKDANCSNIIPCANADEIRSCNDINSTKT